MSGNLIVIGGGLLQLPLIETARSMGLTVIVFDMSVDAPGMQLAHRPVVMSTRDIDGCVREARRLQQSLPINGVVTAGTDASRAVAAIAAALELPGIRYSDAEAASNKVLMRQRLEKAGLPIPGFRSVWSLKAALEAHSELTYPLVIKPADNMGARGVVKISRYDELPAAFRHAKKYSPTGEMILEEFMPGPELSVDALAYNGKFTVTGIADRIISGEPYFIELGHNMPSRQPPAVLEEASDVMKRAMQALGITTGAGKGDLKVTPRGVMIGEVAARLSGGYMSSHTYPLHSGVNLLRAAIEIALGQEPSQLGPRQSRVAIERGIIAVPGKLIGVNGVEAAQSIPGVENIYITRQSGEILSSPTSNLDKIGHIIAVGETVEAAEAAVEKARAKLEIVIDDAYGVNWREVEERARQLFGESICRVCRVCDGENCSSGIPGMGGVGRMTTFAENSRALAELKITPRYIRSDIEPDPSFEFLGRKFDHPIMTAPMTGATTNLNGAIGERELATTLLAAARDSGTIGWVGDCATPEKFELISAALADAGGLGVLICKPRADEKELLRRFKRAEELQLAAVGIDVDAISFTTMRLKGQGSIAFEEKTLKRLRESVKLPFIVKGVVTIADLKLAIEIGADAVVVSNHGGRIIDEMPGTARILPELAEAAGDRITVLVDGGIRSGEDAFKMLALGARAVLVGRPMVIAAVGGEYAGVKFLLNRYRDELSRTMKICGTENLSAISRDYLIRITGGDEANRKEVTP